MTSKYYLARYTWTGDLFSKEGISKSSVYSSGSDTVICGSFNGNNTYIHPSSGLAAVYEDFGKNVEHVIQDIHYKQTQPIESGQVTQLLNELKAKDVEVVEYKLQDQNKSQTRYNSISEAIEENNNSVLSSIEAHRQGRSIDYYSTKVYVELDLDLVPLLQSLGEFY